MYTCIFLSVNMHLHLSEFQWDRDKMCVCVHVYTIIYVCVCAGYVIIIGAENRSSYYSQYCYINFVLMHLEKVGINLPAMSKSSLALGVSQSSSRTTLPKRLEV